MKNYDIEMWRYAKELKYPSEDPKLGHEHKPSTSATLQSVLIRTNSLGLRGPELTQPKPHQPVILFLGSSITLGWGVEEKDSTSAQVEKKLRENGIDAMVLNAGIGNYNSSRYVERFFQRLRGLNPTDIVVHYFLRDAEVLDPGRGNWFLKTSQLAVTLWNLYQQNLMKKKNVSLTSHYEKVYDPNAPGFIAMKESLSRLAAYAKEHGIRTYLAMTPDIHHLVDYPFEGIHRQVRILAADLGFSSVDLYPALKGLKPDEVFSMPGDPHPNALGHERMANAILPMLVKSLKSPNAKKQFAHTN